MENNEESRLIAKYRQEISELEVKRTTFLVWGLILLIGCFIVAVIFAVFELYVLEYLACLGVVGGIALLVLRPAMLGTKIRNRQAKIREYESRAHIGE